jgi:hypothetical protein
MSTTDTAAPTFGTLARKEIVRYVRHPLFWVGSALLAAFTVFDAVSPDKWGSTTLSGLGPAAVMGLFGLVIMASLTRSSDRAAEAAGAVSMSERSRTLALASAVVVPFSFGLVWFVSAVISYQQHPPAPEAIPFGPVDDSFIYATMFAQGVMSCIGGPLLGLVIGRWLPRRGVAPVALVVVVLITILMQGLFDFNERWREIWPWVHFHGPTGVEGDPNRWSVHTGSPYWYIGYQAALCAIGVLVAMLRDAESNRRGLVRALVVVGVVALALLALTITGGYDEVLYNPLPSGRD